MAARVSDQLLGVALRRNVLPWLRQQTSAVEQRNARGYPIRIFPSERSSAASWKDNRDPDQLAASLSNAANARVARLAVMLLYPTVRALRSTTLAIVPPRYALEAEFVASLVVFTYTPNPKDREIARKQLLWSPVSTGPWV